ncbi:MAG: pantoate--beta-alanine ligase [Actinomycetaceae bacterium]|nr:pantoate--beta-alanine ligase [Actinomycetaceae bacterium]
METCTTAVQLRTLVKQWKKQGFTVGFVPTMGYLHEGHLSLVQRSKEICDRTVVSIFVNPTQFGPNEDLDRYPRDFARDCQLLVQSEVDVVFHPDAGEMYPPGFSTFVEPGTAAQGLCGRSRPGHFRGVCTVVAKLLNLVTPDYAFFGQKDAQQVAVIRAMVRDLQMDVRIVSCPIVREEDGLAKSSRNVYLDDSQRQAALVLPGALASAQRMIAGGQTDANAIRQQILGELQGEKLAEVDYVEIVDGTNMQEVSKVHEGDLVAVAVRFGTTRLIDNFTVTK